MSEDTIELTNTNERLGLNVVLNLMNHDDEVVRLNALK